MLNIGEGSSKYVTFWSAEASDKYSDVKLSSSTKNKQTDEWENSNWFARFVGHAHNKISQLNEKDKIEITQGGIKKYYDKDKKKEYFNMVVFDFELMGDGNNSASNDEKPKSKPENDNSDKDLDDLPF